MNRKQRRTLDKQMRKFNSESIADKVSQFNNLPEECSACLSAFDKTNKQMVKTWSVVVRDADTVRLYCPSCWKAATQVVGKYLEEEEKEK